MADEMELDLASDLGAQTAPSVQTLTLYIPDRNRDGEEIGDQRRWVLEAAGLLASIGGGVTIQPAVEGGGHDEQANRLIWERPVLVYAHVHPERFAGKLDVLRSFLHRLGREARQGEVAVEFDGQFFRIREFDKS